MAKLVGVKPRIVLASASPARFRLLRRTGITPEVIVSHVDEEAAVADGLMSVSEQAALLARLKATKVAAEVEPFALVIGCDTTLEMDGQAHNKPSSPDEAFQRWQHMRGRQGLLHTGHCLIEISASGTRMTEVLRTAIVTFATPSDEEIRAYVSTGEPIKVAGAFTLEGFGSAFIEKIDGDPSSVEGLSLPTLRKMAAEFGHVWTDLWAV